MRVADPFQAYDGWQDTDAIKKEVEQALADAAGVKVSTLQRALRRVVADGHYGPLSDQDWKDTDGMAMPMSRAQQIIRDAQDADLPQVIVTDPDHGWTCEGADDCRHPDHEELGDSGRMFHEEPIEIDRAALVRWYFAKLVPIYGGVAI